MIQTMKISSDDKIKSVEPDNSKKFTLEEMQAAVNGLVEIVDLVGHKAFMLINEEGKILSLPPNYIATLIYREEFGSGEVVGDVLIAQYSQID